ncbi:MAG: inositol monophosphatase family protein [Pseudomonadota bacterium]|nr:inositol monophosphatase family protein [Pseudomonadota bacterium]
MRKSPLINVMERAARRAARSLLHDFGEVENLQVSRKGPADFVSQADLQAERILREELAKARPDFGFRLEEGGEVPAKDGKSYWIVDPLDGTTNFLHGVPHFAISIGVEQQGEIVAGMVLEPTRDELFFAERGKGAFLNDTRIRVSARTRMADSLIGTGMPFLGRGGHALFHAELKALTDQVAGVRRLGVASLDLAYVAAGRLDAFWERGLKPWDIAAGIVLVREAGGLVTDLGGGKKMLESGDILAGNTGVHPTLLKLLKDAAKTVAA